MDPSHSYETQLLPFSEVGETNTSRLQLSHLNVLNRSFIPLTLLLCDYSRAFSVRQLLEIQLRANTLIFLSATTPLFSPSLSLKVQ